MRGTIFWARRRVGLREDDDRSARRRPREADPGIDPVQWRRTYEIEALSCAPPRDLQFMFQDPYASLDPRMRVGTILREPLVVQHWNLRRTRARCSDALGGRPLVEVCQPVPPRILGGTAPADRFRERSFSTRMIIADEPVSALDVSIQAQILNLMRDLQASLGLTYVLISHDLAVVRYMADTIGVLYLGETR